MSKDSYTKYNENNKKKKYYKEKLLRNIEVFLNKKRKNVTIWL